MFPSLICDQPKAYPVATLYTIAYMATAHIAKQNQENTLNDLFKISCVQLLKASV